MAYVLSLPSQSPLKRSFSDTSYLHSCSSLSLVSSTGTVRHRAAGNQSSTSLTLFNAGTHSPASLSCENRIPRQVPATSSPPAHELKISPLSIRPNNTPTRTPSVSTKCTTQSAPSPRRDSAAGLATRPPEEVDREARPNATSESVTQAAEVSRKGSYEEHHAIATHDVEQSCDAWQPEDARVTHNHMLPPFRRLVSIIRKRSAEKRVEPVQQRHSYPAYSPEAGELQRTSEENFRHRKSESHSSSSGFLTAVKTASVTLASVSVGPLRSRASRARIDQRSSGNSEVRASIDSNVASLSLVMDEATWLRSVQRRSVLEELISTEESYIADMKSFVNVYRTLLASMPGVSLQINVAIKQNVAQIVELHEEMLRELHKVVPNAECALDGVFSETTSKRRRHTRWHSADIAPPRSEMRTTTRRLRHSLEIGRARDLRQNAITSDTQVVTAVARVFNGFIRRFLVYESWAAQSEALHRDVLMTYKILPACQSIERGLEILATVENPIQSRISRTNKGLTLLDLLIKPIQRLCKYPLLFESLCKQTPACDDPVAHNEIQKVLVRLREMTDEVNHATDNPHTRQLVEITWILQDRLVFSKPSLQTSPADAFHHLGRVILCGVLHIAFETSGGAKGQYMMAVLYRSYLLLATVGRNSTCYTVNAVLPLSNASVHESDDGRGLQCHTAPFTWKLVFEIDYHLNEIMVSACSLAEEAAWKEQLRVRIDAENHEVSEGRPSTTTVLGLSLPDPVSIGSTLIQTQSLARPASMQRAATLGTNKATLRQIVIKNTQAHRVSSEPYTLDGIPTRSQSHLSAAHIPTLAPRRAERIRLETVLADVWTKDALPYPGMLQRGAENPIRASANSVMRKLSMASIASNFSKRSASFASISNSSTRTNMNSSYDDTNSQGSFSRHIRSTSHARQSSKQSGRKPKVDFNSAPDAFLPQDFEIHKGQNKSSRPVTEGRSRSFTSRVANMSLECTRNLRPMTPIVASGPATPTPERRVSDAGTSIAAAQKAISPVKERAKLTKAPRSPEKSQRSAAKETAFHKSKVQKQPTADIKAENDETGPMPPMDTGKGERKTVKVRSMLVRLWTG